MLKFPIYFANISNVIIIITIVAEIIARKYIEILIQREAGYDTMKLASFIA